MNLDLGDSFIYQAFGLKWKSLGLEIPELKLAKNKNNYDVNIQYSDSNTWPKLTKSKYDTDFINISENEFRLTIHDIAKFKICNGNNISWDFQNKNYSEQDLRTFLLSSPMAAILIQRDILLFHGNAMEKNGEAIICLGHSGIGKSTIAYSLMNQGWNVLADDIVALSSNGFVYPGIPRIKLWQDTLKSFNLNCHDLVPVRDKMKKYILNREKLSIASNKSRLKAIYLIRHNQSVFEDKKNVNPIKIKSEKFKFISLRNNTFRPRLIKGLMKEKSYVEKLYGLVKNKNLYILPMPRGIQEMNTWLAAQDL